MRTVFLLPPAALVAVILGCSSEGREQAARSLPKRDLMRQAPASEVGIVSSVELQSLRARHQTLRPSRRASRPAPVLRSNTIEPKSLAAAVAAAPALGLASDSAAKPAGTAWHPVNDRELPPGKTVTVIPTSSGPSAASEPTDEFPTARRGTTGIRGGGRCPPRGRPGIGIATRPRPRLY
jgi:hypothetical protein